MGLAELKIYFDSCVAIYLVEERELYSQKLETIISSLPPFVTCISPLVEMECLILPIREADTSSIEKFNQWFDSVNSLTVTPEVFQASAQLRADFPGLKTPDAIHLATALNHNCDEFWTNDDRLDKIAPDLVKDILS